MNATHTYRLGLLLHRNSRFKGLDRLLQKIRGREDIAAICTERLEDLPGALEGLLLGKPCDALGILGGDGSIHHAINAALGVLRAQGLDSERLPPVYPLLGGSMNMLGQALAIQGDPFSRLARFELGAGALQVREAGLMSVAPEGGPERFGFVFGSEITARAIELHKSFGGHLLGLARLLSSATLGLLLRTDFWERCRKLLELAPEPLLADGIRYPYLAAVASTIDLKLMRGWITGLRAGDRPLRARILEPSTPLGVIERLPHLALGWSNRRILDLDGVGRLELSGDYSLDGEVYRQAGRLTLERTRLRVRFLA